MKYPSDAPPILLLKIKTYDFIITYVPSIQIPWADALSQH